MNFQSEDRDTLLRLSQILAPNGPFPVSKSTWWAGVKTGRFPKPIKLGPRTTVWRASDLLPLLADGVIQPDFREAPKTTVLDSGSLSPEEAL